MAFNNEQAHTVYSAIKGSEMTNVKQFKRENKQSNLCLKKC